MVKVKEAKKLLKTGFIGKADPYVQIGLWYKDTLVAEDKTETKNNTQDPIFKKTVFFDMPNLDQDAIKDDFMIKFKVMDEDFGKDDVIGELVIGGSNCTGTALEHWKQAIYSPITKVELWHPITEFGITTSIKADEKEPLVNEEEIEHQKSNKDKFPSAIEKVSSFISQFGQPAVKEVEMDKEAKIAKADENDLMELTKPSSPVEKVSSNFATLTIHLCLISFYRMEIF